MTNINGNKKIEELLNNKNIVSSFSISLPEILEKIKQKKEIKIIYGETYDNFGITIDSLKYYFFLSKLHEALEELELNVKSYVVVGDSHSVLNKDVKNKKELLKKAKENLGFINKVKEVYKLPFEVLLMSEEYKSDNFGDNFNKVKEIFDSSEELQEIAKKTILKNRLAQEEKAGFRYTLEEVALIMDYDIKIGPPREKHYDSLAQNISGNLTGIYLKPTYPLGFNFDFFLNSPEIEEFGVTPYKAGSNRLEKNRIILGKNSLSNIKHLVRRSFQPKNTNLPNPVLDLELITKMAAEFLRKRKSGNLIADLDNLVFRPLEI